MKVILSDRLIRAASADTWKVHRLLIYACEGRHVLVFDPPEAMELCLETFAAETRDEYAKAIGLAARTAASLPHDTPTIRVEVAVQPIWEDPVAVLPIDDALAVLDEPLGILVENADNDWSFLLGVMRPSERERMLRAVSKRWAEPLHGGGSTLSAMLEARLTLLRWMRPLLIGWRAAGPEDRRWTRVA